MKDFIFGDGKSREQLKKGTREYLNTRVPESDYSDCIGLSLTMKQWSNGIKLDDIRASQNFRHFMNVLNRKTYGQQFKRGRKQLSVVPTIENSSSDLIHYHALIKRPDYCESEYDEFKFISNLKAIWKATEFGNKQTHIHRSTDSGWLDYITKLKHQDDQIDWLNCYWN